jgi:hypothetical protein
MAVLIRILMVMFAYLLACIAAAVILVVSLLMLHGGELHAAEAPTWMLWVLVAIGAGVIAAVGAMPSLLVIALAEGFAWRSSLIYAVLGGALMLALGYSFDAAGQLATQASSPGREAEVLAAAGIAGGFVYWLFAGRKAGIWK